MNARSSAPRRSRLDVSAYVDFDKLCAKCEYNLKGLPWGSLCPECGSPIPQRGGKRATESLILAPIPYLWTLRIACMILAASAIVGAVTAILTSLSYIFHGLTVCATVAWFIGAWIVSEPRQGPAGGVPISPDELRLARAAARWLQLGWILAGGVTLAALEVRQVPILNTPWRLVFAIAWLACIGCGLAGLVALCLVLSNLAHYAMEPTLGERFRMVAWAMVCCGGLSAVCIVVIQFAFATAAFTFIAGLAGFIFFITSSLFVVALLLFVVFLCQMAHLTYWAVINAKSVIDRNARLARRAAPQPTPIAAPRDDAPLPLVKDSTTPPPDDTPLPLADDPESTHGSR